MKSSYKLQTEMHIRQLERLISTCKRMKFTDAYYVIFSDYPSDESLSILISDPEIEINTLMLKKLNKEHIRLMRKEK